MTIKITPWMIAGLLLLINGLCHMAWSGGEFRQLALDNVRCEKELDWERRWGVALAEGDFKKTQQIDREPWPELKFADWPGL